MNYVEFFDLLGEEAKQIPSITGAGAPTTLTEGAVGCLYMDTTTGEIYKCTSVTDGAYIWELIGSGSVELAQTLEGNEEGKAPSVQAVNTALGDKLDKVTNKTNGRWAYTINKGAQELMQLNTTPTGWSIPLYAGNGVIYTADPTQSVSGDADLAATNKKYVDDALAGKVDIIEPTAPNIQGVPAYIKKQNTETGEYYYQQNFKRIADGIDSVATWNLPQYLPNTETYGSATKESVVLLSGEPKLPPHVATKNYVDTTTVAKETDTTKLGNFGGLYGINTSGEDVIFKVTNQTGSNSIPLRGAGGVIVAGTPTAGAHVATKNYVDNAAIPLQTQANDLERRLTNVEQAAKGNIYDFITDDSAAYKKTVPSTSLPYAMIEKVGGAVDFDGDSTTIFTSPYDIYYNESELTVDWDQTGAYTFSGLLGESAEVVIYDVNFPEPISAGTYEFYLEGDGTNWSIWNADIEVYEADSDYTYLYSDSVRFTDDARMSFTLEKDGMYILRFSTISAVGEIGTITVTPKLVKKGVGITRSPVTAIEIHGENLFNESAITQAANSKAEANTACGVVENGYLRAKYGAYGFSVLWLPFKMSLDVGRYTVSADVYVGSSAPSLTGYIGLSAGTEGTNLKRGRFDCSAYDMWERKTVTVAITESGDYFFTGCGNGAAGNYTNLDVRFKNIQVEKSNTATDFSPYLATIYNIPQEVLDLKDQDEQPIYGIGINDTLYNYIDFENKTLVRMVGQRMWELEDEERSDILTDAITTIYPLDEVDVVDISQYLTLDGDIEVEGNGTIVFENELKLDVPSTITYQVKL